jgi:drug/metabolite transporter (DMT)-like permease
VLELTLLAMIWGGSFLCYRIAAPEFGPIALVALRVGLAALILAPTLLLKGRLSELRGRGRELFVVGAINSALPFCLLAYATLSLTAGLASVLNATSPLWGGLVAHFWLRDRLTRSRTVGLFVGFAGVLILFWDRTSFTHGGAGLALLAALAATFSYGVGANMAKPAGRRRTPRGRGREPPSSSPRSQSPPGPTTPSRLERGSLLSLSVSSALPWHSCSTSASSSMSDRRGPSP